MKRLYIIYTILLAAFFLMIPIKTVNAESIEFPDVNRLNGLLGDNNTSVRDSSISNPIELKSLTDSMSLQDSITQGQESIAVGQATLRINTPQKSDTDTSVSVSDWNGFVSAATNPKITTIDLTASFEAKDKNAIFNGDKIINFNGFALNMAGYSLATQNNNVQFNNASLSSTKDKTILKVTGGKLTFTGLTKITGVLLNTSSGSKNSDPNIYFTNARIDMGSSVSDPIIELSGGAEDQTIIDVTNSEMYDSSQNLFDLESKIKIVNIKKSNIYSLSSIEKSHFIDSSIAQRSGTSDGVQLNVVDGSQMNIKKQDKSDPGRVILLAGEHSKLDLSGAAKLNVENSSGAAILISGKGATADISGDETELDVVRGNQSGGNVYSSPIRFYQTGDMTFNISDKAKVNITQNIPDKNGYGIRMFGGNNYIHVSDGAEFNLYNNSIKGTPGTDNSGGQGIYYASGDEKKPNGFTVKDKDSQVLISAHNGPAISSISSPIIIEAGDRTSFVARGYYERNAIFNAKNKTLTFNMGVPRYFDFMNLASINSRQGDSLLFEGSTESAFQHGSVPLSVWVSTSDVSKSPTKSWNYVNATYSSKKYVFDTANTENEDFQDWLDNNYGLSGLSRMTANISPAKINGDAPLETPTNADKYIWINALMPAENNAFRPAYDDEVYANVEVKRAGEVVKTVTAKSINSADYYEYGTNNTISGILKIPASDFGTEFLQAGDQITVTKLWRNDADPTSPAAIVSSDSDITYGTKTVIAKRPPKPAEIKDGSTEISQWATELDGVNGDPGDTVSWQVIHTDGSITSHNDVATVASDRTWKITGISNILNNDKIRIILKNKNGISNPTELTKYHDDEFEPATTINVGGTDSIVLNVPTSLDFGVVPALGIGTMKPGSKSYNVTINDDRSPAHGDWMLSVKASNFKSENTGKEISNNQLSLGLDTKKGYKNISGDTDVLARVQQDTDPYRGPTILDYINGPDQLKLKYNGVSDVGSHSSTITWTATDSL